MQNPLAVAGFMIAIGAAALAGYALSNAPMDTADLETRLAVTEDRLARLEGELDRRDRQTAPSLMGLAPERVANERPEAPVASGGGPTATASGVAAPPTTPKKEAALRELVDEAVERKAAQLQAMRNKKPPIELFAKMLALDEGQRAAVERGVVASQHEIKGILEIEMADGTNFVDALVEVVADGMANPGKHPGRGKALFSRLLREKIPGSDETYAQRVESVKSRLRDTVKRELTPKQHTVFQAWQMDPTEIKEIPGSPWKELEARMIERARQLGAKIPAPGEKR